MKENEDVKFNTNHTYCLRYENGTILMLNRKYIPTSSTESFAVDSKEYYDFRKSRAVNINLTREETLNFLIELEIACHEGSGLDFYLYNEACTLQERQVTRERVSKVLQKYTGKGLEFYE